MFFVSPLILVFQMVYKPNGIFSIYEVLHKSNKFIIEFEDKLSLYPIQDV